MIAFCIFLIFILTGLVILIRYGTALPIMVIVMFYFAGAVTANNFGFTPEETYTIYLLYDVAHPYLITDEGMDYSSFLLADPDTGAPRVEQVKELSYIVYSDEDPYTVRVTTTHYNSNWFGKYFSFMRPADERKAILYLPSPI